MPEPDAPRTLRALLVGIDEYRSPVPALRGCVNDITRVAAWLEKRAVAAGDRFDPLVLLNGQATRQAVIDGFRRHLGAASGGDTAVFYYSGHGSQEPALPEQLRVEPDAQNETLVLADSRHGDVADLADKELALLVDEVAAVAGHVLVVLDCCHSGSGVRAIEEIDDDVRVRRAPTRETPRPRGVLPGRHPRHRPAVPPTAGATCCSPPAVRTRRRRRCGSTASRAGCSRWRWSGRWPGSAARRPTPTSNAGWPPRPATWPSTSHRCWRHRRRPTPGCGSSAAWPPRPLRCAPPPSSGRVGWQLDAGRLHGVAPVAAGDPTELSLHRLGAGPDSAVVTTATVTAVGATTSELAVADPGALDRDATYLAVVTRSGTPQATVAVHGEGELAADVRERVRRSRTVAPAADDRGADIVIDCTGPELSVRRPTSGRPLAAAVPAAAPAAAAQAVATAEHIGWWIDLTQRTNLSSALRPDDVRLAVVDGAGDPVELVGGAVELTLHRRRWSQHRHLLRQQLRRSAPLRGAGAQRALRRAVPHRRRVRAVAARRHGVGARRGRPAAGADVRARGPGAHHGRAHPAGRHRPLRRAGDAAARAGSASTRSTDGPGGARGFDRGPAPVPAGSDWTTRTLLVTTVRPGA